MTAEGHVLGTLCVIDHKPRELTAEQARALQTLSHQVVAQLRLHKQLAEQLRINAELEQTNKALQAEVALRLRALGEAGSSARAFVSSLGRDLETHGRERDRLRSRLGMGARHASKAAVADGLDLEAARDAIAALLGA